MKKLILFIAPFLLFLTPANIAYSHATGCGHVHQNMLRAQCNTGVPGTACTDPATGNPGTCKQIVGFGFRDCICAVPKKPKTAYGLFSFKLQRDSFSFPGKHLFKIQSGMQNTGIDIYLDGNLDKAAYSITDGISGEAEIDFLESTDSLNFPAVLTQFSLSFPSITIKGLETGVNYSRINPETEIKLTYNRETGELIIDDPVSLINYNDIFPENSPYEGVAIVSAYLNEDAGTIDVKFIESAEFAFPKSLLKKYWWVGLLLLILFVALISKKGNSKNNS